MSNSLWPHGLYSPLNSLGQNTAVGSLSLLQQIFPLQGSNSGLPHCSQILYQLSNKGSPRILEWVAYPFSSRSSWPRNWTEISCSAGGFFTSGALGIIQWHTNFQFSNCVIVLWCLGFPGGSVVKNLPANAGESGLIPGSGRSPGEGNGYPTPVFLPGKSDGQRGLVGYSPWSHKELDMA